MTRMRVHIEKNTKDNSFDFEVKDATLTDILEFQLFSIDVTGAILNNVFDVNMGDVNHEEITKDLNIKEINQNLVYLRNEIESKLNKINNDIDNLLK